jgi:hypothetical protein
MASVSSIEVSNFLCDGYEPGGEWVPLYRGVTLRLFGSPAALQIDNGGGKSSLTDGCLYLLSRDRRLKPKVEDRAAPPDKGWTHVRIEFIERDTHDDVLQGDLITQSPENAPGTHYVVGLCWNRGKEPIFYRYKGVLSDAPSYRVVDDRLELVANDEFRKSVEAMERVVWNKWGNIHDWQSEISGFTNMDIIRQNVEFQIEGAGDYSAMVTKVKQQRGQRYDEMFFRQFIAPELLRRPLGDESDAEEYKFEDALFRTLKPTALALMEIGQKEADLENARSALDMLGPVERRAQDVVEAEVDLEKALGNLATSAALIDALTQRDPLPGVPKPLASRSWMSDKKLMNAVSHLAICRQHGLVITDAGLSELTGVIIGEINRRVPSKKILFAPLALGPWLGERSARMDQEEPTTSAANEISQVLDSKDHLKEDLAENSGPDGARDGAQGLDFKDHLKNKGRGRHRKHPVTGYDLQGALEAVNAVRGLAAADMSDVLSMLPRAFGIGGEVDTNSYRREADGLAADKEHWVGKVQNAEADQRRLQQEVNELQRGEHEFHEDEIAYQNFLTRAGEFREEYREAPLLAEKWAVDEVEKANDAIAKHDVRCGQLEDALQDYLALKTALGDTTLEAELGSLNSAFVAAQSRHALADRAVKDAHAMLERKRREHGAATQAWRKIEQVQRDLAALFVHQEPYQRIFGDADPDAVNPQKALADAHVQLRKLEGQAGEATRRKASIDAARNRRDLYKDLFGTVAPATLNTASDLAVIVARLTAENDVVAQEQPFVSALASYRLEHPDTAPADRLREIESIKSALLTERIGLDEEHAGILQEVADLDAFAVADERVYSHALKLLTHSGVAFVRLREVICQHANGARREQLLILFSAALSAPVVDSLDTADKATFALEQGKLTVPVFLASGLLAFIDHGPVETSGSLGYTFLVGRRTRQVEITLNPNLVVEEKQRAAGRTAEIVARLEQIRVDLSSYQGTSAGVMTTVAAGQALVRGSVEKATHAAEEIERLTPLHIAAERRASSAALDAIGAQKVYLTNGGDEGYQELTAVTIPRLEQEVAANVALIGTLSAQVTPEAGAAQLAMQSFKRAGGIEELVRMNASLADAGSVVGVVTNEIDEITTRLSFELNPGADDAQKALRAIEVSYEAQRDRLKAAISFESDDGPAFMAGRAEARVTLASSQKAYQTALTGIDFKRAARYVALTRAQDRSFSERLTAAQQKLDATIADLVPMRTRLVDIDSRAAQIRPFVELLHDLAQKLVDRHTQLAILPDDLRLNAARIVLEPAVLKSALDLQLACMGGQPGTTDEVRAAIHNISVTVEAIELDTSHIVKLQRDLTRVRSEFDRERDEYCRRARSGNIKGLQINEIEKIENARTANDLARLHDLKEVIARQVESERAAVQKISESMQSNKVATIDNLVQLARQAEVNLRILHNVMKRHPSACFKIDVQVASEEKIGDIINRLVSDIQDRETTSRDRSSAASNSDIGERDDDYRNLIHDRIYKDMFLAPSVHFVHTAIRPNGETLFTAPGVQLSTGQHTALAMMWLVRHAEYAQARAVMTLGTKREQKAALKGSQRIMFFDGLFSNLSNESYIDAAFHGLKDVGESFQLIGLIHNPHYVNNPRIFPVHLVGKKRRDKNIGRERTFMTFKRWQADNGVAFFTSALKQGDQNDSI